MVKRERRVVNGKVPQHTPFHFLSVSSKILVFAESFSKCDSEPSTKALQDAVIHACVGVEVIPQGPPEGDHMAKGRVEMAVRQVKRQCRPFRISDYHTGVRVADDSPLISRFPRFAAQVMNKVRIGQDGKTSALRRTGRRCRKPRAQVGEKVCFRKFGEDGVSSFASRMTQGIFVGRHAWQNRSSFARYQVRSCARQKLEKTDTERCFGIDEFGWFVWQSVVNGSS